MVSWKIEWKWRSDQSRNGLVYRYSYVPSLHALHKYPSLKEVVLIDYLDEQYWEVCKNCDEDQIVMSGHGTPPTCEQVWVELEIKRYEEMFEGTGQP